jgi:hypothetical protein
MARQKVRKRDLPPKNTEAVLETEAVSGREYTRPARKFASDRKVSKAIRTTGKRERVYTYDD